MEGRSNRQDKIFRFSEEIYRTCLVSPALASRFGNTPLPANGANERLRNFPMTRHWRTLIRLCVLVDPVAAPFAREAATVRLQMTDYLASFHGMVVPMLTEMCWPV